MNTLTACTNSRAVISTLLLLIGLAAALLAMAPEVQAHGVTEGDKGYIQESSGQMIIPFVYLGAKHMVTGYDHLLFLFWRHLLSVPTKRHQHLCDAFCCGSLDHAHIGRIDGNGSQCLHH